MPIEVKIVDKVSKSIEGNIAKIGQQAKSAALAINSLKKSLSIGRIDSLDKLAAASRNLASSIEKRVAITSRLIAAQRDLHASDNKSAIAAERLSREKIKTAGAIERQAIAARKAEIAMRNLEIQEKKLVFKELKRSAPAGSTPVSSFRPQQNVASFDKSEIASRKAYNNTINRTVSAIKDQNSATKDLFTTNRQLTQLTKIYIGLELANYYIRTADAATNLGNRLRLVSDSQEQLNTLQRKIFEIASKTRTPIDDISIAFQRYDFALRQLGASQVESLKFTETLSKSVTLSGLSTLEAGQALRQLSQALNKGKLDGDEFRTVMETMPLLFTALSKELNVSKGELLDLAPKGKITADVIRKAVARMGKDVDEAFSKLPVTIGQSFTVLQNKITEYISNTDKATGVNTLLANSVLTLANNLNLLGGAVVGVGIVLLTKQMLGFASATLLASKRMTAFNLLMKANPYILAATAIVGLGVAMREYARDVTIAEGSTEKLIDLYDQMAKQTFGEVFGGADFDHFIESVKDAPAVFSRALAQAQLVTLDFLGIVDGKKVIADTIKANQEREKALKAQEKSLRAAKQQDAINKSANKILSDMTKSITAFKEESDAIVSLLNKGKITFEEMFDLIDSTDFGSTVKDIENFVNQRNALMSESIKAQNDEELRLFKEGINKKITILNIALRENPQLAAGLGADKLVEELRKILKSADDFNKKQRRLSFLGDITADLDEFRKKIKEGDLLLSEGVITTKEYQDALKETASAQKLLNLSADEFAKNQDVWASYERMRDAVNEARMANIRFIESFSVDDLYAIGLTVEDAAALIEKVNANAMAELDAMLDNINKRRDEAKEAILQPFDSDPFAPRGGPEEGRNAAQDEFNQRLESLRLYHEQGLILTEEYNQRRIELEQKYSETLRNINLQNTLQSVDYYAQAAGAIGDILATSAKEGSKTAKVAFRIQQAAALAGAIVKTSQAAVESLANNGGVPYGIPAMTAAIATGSAQVAAIAAQSIKAFADGGFVSGPGTKRSDSIPARLSNGEFVVNADATRRNRSLLESINNGSSMSSGGNSSVYVNVYNNANGVQVKTETTKDENGNDRIDLIVEMVDKRLAANISNNTGALNSQVRSMVKRDF